MSSKKTSLEKLFQNSDSLIVIKLAETTPLKNVKNEELKDLLNKFYKKPNPNMNKIATFLNAIITNNAKTFILSRRILEDLIKNDVNTDVETLNSNSYKMVLHSLLLDNIIVKIKPAFRRKSAIYQIKQQAIIDIMEEKDEDFFKNQEQAILDFYNDKKSDTIKEDKPVIETPTDLINREGALRGKRKIFGD